MSQVHWFPWLGFRPSLEVLRKDFAGKSGWNLHTIVAPDSDVPYASKFEPRDMPPLPELFAYLLPPSYKPAQETSLKIATASYPRYDQDHLATCAILCGPYIGAPEVPEIPSVPLPSSILLLAFALLIVKACSHICRRPVR